MFNGGKGPNYAAALRSVKWQERSNSDIWSCRVDGKTPAGLADQSAAKLQNCARANLFACSLM